MKLYISVTTVLSWVQIFSDMNYSAIIVVAIVLVVADVVLYSSTSLFSNLIQHRSVIINTWWAWLIFLLHHYMYVIMMSSNGFIFRVTGSLWGEFTGGFPSQRPVTRSFDVFFDLRMNIWMSAQSRRWWFETSSRSLWRHCNVWVHTWLCVRVLLHKCNTFHQYNSHWEHHCRIIANASWFISDKEWPSSRSPFHISFTALKCVVEKITVYIIKENRTYTLLFKRGNQHFIEFLSN